MTVHNHGTEEGKGLACRESLVNGKLRGECMSESANQQDADQSLRTRIAAVVGSHRPQRREWITCICDGHFSHFTEQTWEWHVADAVIREIPELQARCGCHTKNWAEEPAPTHCNCGEPLVDWGVCAKHLEEGLADDE